VHWLVVIGVAVAATAHAQPVPGGQAAEGARLFEEARVLVKEGKFAEACEKFTQSYQLDRAAGTQLNLGTTSPVARPPPSSRAIARSRSSRSSRP